MSAPPDKTGPALQGNWDWRAACNFLFGGAGTGVLIAAALAFAPADAYRAAGIAGLFLTAAGLFCVWLEIGRPLRAANVLRHAQTSWMTREAMVAPVLFLAGIAAVVQGPGWWSWLAAFAAGAFLYCQARMIPAAKGIPAWRHPMVTPLLASTGLAEGAGLLLVVGFFFGEVSPWTGAALVALVALRWLVWTRFRSSLGRLGAPRRSLDVLEGIARPFALAGSLLPVLLLLAAAAFAASWAAALAGACALAGGWYVKFVLITRAAYDQGFALPRLPVRGTGRAGPAAKPGWTVLR